MMEKRFFCRVPPDRHSSKRNSDNETNTLMDAPEVALDKEGKSHHLCVKCSELGHMPPDLPSVFLPALSKGKALSSVGFVPSAFCHTRFRRNFPKCLTVSTLERTRPSKIASKIISSIIWDYKRGCIIMFPSHLWIILTPYQCLLWALLH